MYTVRLGQLPDSDEVVGMKAASLMRLAAQQDILVPDGFVLTTAAHQAFLTATRAPDEPPTLPLTVGWAVDQALASFSPGVQFAVRSSGTMEDLAHASFAGQYETVLGVLANQVAEAIIQCWMSASTDLASQYAADRGLAFNTPLMGVIVQEMVCAEVAGVSFSIHPVTGSKTIVINASYGLGEAVVSGLVTPDSFEINRLTSEVRSLLGPKEYQILPSPTGRTYTTPTPADLSERFCLSERDIRDIVVLTETLEAHVGQPVDVEWAMAEGRLYCLQVRPITTSAAIPKRL